ncbi:MAG: SRPBCC family protein [Acidimicrobiales bacterium]
MELTNEFDVAVPVEAAWAVLTDVERIAPCLPGAELREVEGDEYRGVVKVKVGPITTSYQGVARFIELDESAHRAVLRAEGRESRGQGNASAVITATMSATDTGTRVSVVTDLSITGKVAQFGRGVLADVSTKLLDTFVANLESTVLEPSPPSPDSSPPESTDAADPGGPAAASGTAESDAESPSGARRIESASAAPVDLGALAGASVARRIARQLIVVGAVLIVASRAVWRRHRSAGRPDDEGN